MTDTITGIGVSPGLAAGPVYRMPDAVGEPRAAETLPASSRDAEAARIATAMEQVCADLQQRASRAAGEVAEILEATALMAADPSLRQAAENLVLTFGLSAPRAVWQSAGEVAAALESSGEYLAARARDVYDVRDRIVAALTGRPAPGVPSPAEPFVLVADDLAPADTATLDPARVVAIVIASGGPTSHTAILARALGIPAVVAADGILQVDEGTQILVDGASGVVSLKPSADQRRRAAQLASAVPRRFRGPCTTADGWPVLLLANVGDPAGARAAAEAGAEGIGLFRTEFCFLGRHTPPSCDEQAQIYADVMRPFAGARVVVRTLDAGADKPMPFLTSADEPNPALGVRGLRTSWGHPEVLSDQLEAIARAAALTQAQVWVMAPMVATAEEARLFTQACAEHGLESAGVMVEVPSAALTARAVLREAAFASIGTNDLVQYAMAADRMIGALAHLNDPFQPALVRLIGETCSAGAEIGRPVGVCGEAAADAAMACVLAGLGASSLSMSAPALAGVAAAISGTTREALIQAAKLAQETASAVDGRRAVRAALPHLVSLGL